MSIKLSERHLDSKVLASQDLDFRFILCAWGYVWIGHGV